MKEFKPTLHLIKEFTLHHKSRICQLGVLSLTLPICEVGLIGAIYIILNQSTPEFVQSFYTQSGDPIFNVSVEYFLIILACLSLLGIIIVALLKRYLAIITTKTQYDIYVDQVNKTSELYFSIPGWGHLKERNDEILNIVFNLTGSTAHYYVGAIKIAFNCIAMTILLIAAFWSSVYLTIIALVIGCTTVIINYRNFKKMQLIGDEKQQSQQDVINELYQSIQSFELIKFDQLQDSILKKVSRVMRREWNWRVDRRSTTATANVLSDSVGSFSILLLATANTFLINASIATLIVLILLLNRIRTYTTEFQNNLLQIKECIPSVLKSIEATSRFNNYIAKQGCMQKDWNTSVKFINVNFSYDSTPVLQDINLEISPGDRVLLSGPSGEGKSTLLKLITGYYYPDSGSINVGHTSISTYQMAFETIQDHIFYCNNDLFLPNTTLKEALDRNGALEDTEIMELIEQACLNELLDSQGSLNMMIGENASNLSEGQRQRLLLSRLFLKNPEIIILDESTSNLDIKTETNILDNIKNHITPNSILIISAHKVPPSIRFNKTLSMSGGKLASI